MIDNQKVLEAVFEAIDEINEQRPEDQQVEKSADTVLFGKGGTLTSLELVNLIVTVEQALDDAFDVSVTLADEKAMSQSRSPFKSVQTLADYAAGLMKEED